MNSQTLILFTNFKSTPNIYPRAMKEATQSTALSNWSAISTSFSLRIALNRRSMTIYMSGCLVRLVSTLFFSEEYARTCINSTMSFFSWLLFSSMMLSGRLMIAVRLRYVGYSYCLSFCRRSLLFWSYMLFRQKKQKPRRWAFGPLPKFFTLRLP